MSLIRKRCGQGGRICPNERTFAAILSTDRGCQSGDFDAYRMIVNEYSNALLSVAYSVLGDFHEAQDAVQEAFLKCYRNLHILNDPAKLGSWLYAIAHRTSLDFAKEAGERSRWMKRLYHRTISRHGWNNM